jgi:hypothetical protein
VLHLIKIVAVRQVMLRITKRHHTRNRYAQ